MSRARREGHVVAVLPGEWVSHAHTFFAYSAFLGSLVCGMLLHYKKIVKNEHYGYPDEWFPSVSATIGDWYPERNLFQIFIAITSGPRFALVVLWYFLTRHKRDFLPKFVAFVGILRTVMCGGWVYVTSTDDHMWHDVFMISYLILTIPWVYCVLASSPINPRAVKYRKIFAGLFFGTLVPLVYYFIQHKVHRIPGAYTIYAFFEWALIIYDVAFDACTALDFKTFEVRLVDVLGESAGNRNLANMAVDNVKEKKDDLFTAATGQSVALTYLAETYLAFVFWSELTSLGLMVWYFPLWHMGISGAEIIILTSTSPFFLGSTLIRKIVAANTPLFFFISLIGLASYLIHDVLLRLIAVGAGVAISTLVWMSMLHEHAHQSLVVRRLSTQLLLGLIASSVAKMAYWTNNPIWPIVNGSNYGWNKTGIFFGLLSCIQLYRSPIYSSTRGVDLYSPKSNRSSVLAGLALGGLFFGLHTLLCDSSTLILWVWNGFPVRGPLVVPHGVLTIATMALGCLAGAFSRDGFVTSWGWFANACAGVFLFYLVPGWIGYLGGLLFAFYLTSISSRLIENAVSISSPGATFGLAWLFYDLLLLASVWVVAYAFVPGGPLLRERTDLILVAIVVVLACGTYSMRSADHPKAYLKASNFQAQLLKRYTLLTAVSLCIVASAIAFMRFPTFNYQPYHPEVKLFTAGIWTVHFGIDNEMWASEVRMRDALLDLELDIVGLLETDTQRAIGGFRDMTQFLSEDLGMYVDFGPGPNKHTWGAALLSKFPIINSTHHLLPSPVGELAPAIHATLDVFGTFVDVIVSHNGQEEDPEDRRLQTTELSRIMRDSPRPFVFLGYVVTLPHQGNYHLLIDEARMNDIDPSDHDRWCEYIAYRGVHRVGYARISRGTITDTEIQAGKFIVPNKITPAISTVRLTEEQVPLPWRFPSKFYGEGVRGHRFHVFDEPRYFAEPDETL